METLIIRFLQGRATPDEESALHAWRRASPDNERTYHEIEAVWSELAEAKVEYPPPPPELIVSRAEARRAREPRPWDRSRLRTWFPAAAAAAVLILGVGEYARRSLVGGEEERLAGHVITATTGSRLEQLSDGTIVHLAPGSRLRIAPAAERREVWLEGRAFFAVATDPDRSFVVHGPVGDARVLGTRFEFSSDDRTARVLVVDGRVAFSASDERAEIRAAQLAEVEANGDLLVREVTDVESLLGWMGHSFAFHHTPLEQAVREISSRFGATVEVTDERLRRETISGGFHDQSFDEIMTTLCRVLDATCEIEELHAVISSHGLGSEARLATY